MELRNVLLFSRKFQSFMAVSYSFYFSIYNGPNRPWLKIQFVHNCFNKWTSIYSYLKTFFNVRLFPILSNKCAQIKVWIFLNFSGIPWFVICFLPVKSILWNKSLTFAKYFRYSLMWFFFSLLSSKFIQINN